MGVGLWLVFWRWMVVKVTEYKHSVRCCGLWGQELGTGFFCGKAGGCDILRGIALSLKLIP